MILPESLQLLIQKGILPTNKEQALKQNTTPLVSSDVLNRFVSDELRIFFYAPPFFTIAQRISHGEAFWAYPEAALTEVDPNKILLIGDFGSGSDTVFGLDYSVNKYEPSVIRLKWSDVEPDKNNHWVRVTQTFKEFCDNLGLT